MDTNDTITWSQAIDRALARRLSDYRDQTVQDILDIANYINERSKMGQAFPASIRSEIDETGEHHRQRMDLMVGEALDFYRRETYYSRHPVPSEDYDGQCDFIEVPIFVGGWVKVVTECPNHVRVSEYGCGCSSAKLASDPGIDMVPNPFCARHGFPEHRRVALLSGWVVWDERWQAHRVVRHPGPRQTPVSRYENGLELEIKATDDQPE
jgi:hypothetical protein